jgi:hypothetical protein
MGWGHSSSWGHCLWAIDLPLGWLKGTRAARLKLDAKEVEIQGYLAKGISERSIAKHVERAP